MGRAVSYKIKGTVPTVPTVSTSEPGSYAASIPGPGFTAEKRKCPSFSAIEPMIG